jgi:glycosyltransferase involved in cell wall biosynthesis/2-polyprenyl-3-methyl-5-hydroxy-6-metoxy-1,4-benzoquinol methylase
MFIVLHCGGIPFNGETIKERSLGGSESAAYYLAKHLAMRGHQVSIFTKHEEEGVFDGVRYLFMGAQDANYPMGERYHFYCTNTPHDVNIAQRHPLAFQHRFASKVNLLWLHDIALARNGGAVNSTMWNVDGVMPVSEFHKQQIIESWKFESDIITPITNGVDRSLYVDNDEEVPEPRVLGGLNLLYQSRPERGLENLVKPDGIMERLLEKRPDATLYVCGYKHDVPEMQGFYDSLYARVDEFDNCVNLGHMPKRELAALQIACDALVYPTEFEEVSCITAMEAMNAGLPMIASKFAALPETCKGAGSILIKHKKGQSDIPKFVNAIASLDTDSPKYKKLVEKQLTAAEKYTWSATADQVEAIIAKAFAKVQNDVTIVKELIRTSDIIACERFLDRECPPELHSPIASRCLEELEECYQFANDDESYKEHYRVGTNAFYDGDFQRVGRETVEGGARFECISSAIADLPSAQLVIDYGCAHGHFTIGLAKRFPECTFVGIDVSERAISEARNWAEDDGVTNIVWFVGTASEYLEEQQNVVHGETTEAPLADAVITAEVLEHVRNPKLLMSQLASLMKDGGQFILTTPYGPWEQMSYQKDYPTRFHLHHFERADLHDLFGHHEGFNIIACPSGTNPGGDVVGQYITTFKFAELELICGFIDYERKFATVYPRQTVSLCMIAKDSEQTLGKALSSISGYVDEVIIAVDQTTTDRTEQVIKQFDEDTGLWPVVRTIPIDSPIETGFDEARNSSIEEANGDWILWFDSDEEVIEPQSIVRLLRGNQFKGYPLPQTHFSIDPLQVLNTDFPVRLFRNRADIKFFGVVHEHPETGMNEGIGAAFIQQHPIFSHNGYVTERVRRARFDRNFPLMQRDRVKYPDRILGKFLWIRDVAHACQFHIEESGGQIIPEMLEAARDAIGIWEELLETDQVRMIEDSMKYYSLLCDVLGSDLSFAIRVGASKLNGGVNLLNEKEINCKFYSMDHLRKFSHKLIDEKVKGYETEHF